MNFGAFVNGVARKIQATMAKRPGACCCVFYLAQLELSETQFAFLYMNNPNTLHGEHTPKAINHLEDAAEVSGCDNV